MKLFGFYGVRFKVESFEIEQDHKDRYVCYVGVCQEFEMWPVADTVKADSLRRIEVSNFCAIFDCMDASYCPGPDSVDIYPLHYFSDGVLSGPFYRYGCAHIDKDCKSVRVVFLARLLNRQTGEELAHRTVDTTLRR